MVCIFFSVSSGKLVKVLREIRVGDKLEAIFLSRANDPPSPSRNTSEAEPFLTIHTSMPCDIR